MAALQAPHSSYSITEAANHHYDHLTGTKQMQPQTAAIGVRYNIRVGAKICIMLPVRLLMSKFH